MPLITVIVPIYNVEPYLRRCVDSILAQTFTEFEVILVDDGSPDNCGAICDEYAMLDTRVHVIHQQNGGLSAARNAGIDWAFENSGSEWLGFVDSDDWVHPEFLSFLLRAAKENSASVSACGFIRIDEPVPFQNEVYSAKCEQWDEFYTSDPVVGAIAVNKLYQKRLFKDLRYPVGRIHEDEFLTYKLLYKAGAVAIVSADLYYYYQNPNGIMGSEFSLKRLDAVDALKQQCDFAKRTGSKLFYNNRIRSFAFCCCKNLEAVAESKNIDPKIKQAVTRRLRHSLQKALIGAGGKAISRSEYPWCYEAAFPKSSWCCWTIKGAFQKIKRSIKRNADD